MSKFGNLLSVGELTQIDAFNLERQEGGAHSFTTRKRAELPVPFWLPGFI